MSTDTSPLRPWEKYQVDAFEWDEAQSLQQAFRDGAQSYHREKQRREDQDAKAEALRQALLEQFR